LSAHVQNHMTCEYVPKSITRIVNIARDFAINDWNFEDLAAFVAIFSYIFNAHAQKRLYKRFWLKV